MLLVCITKRVFFPKACHESCEENCTGEGTKGCLACKTGYEMTEDVGCKGTLVLSEYLHSCIEARACGY